MTGPVEEFDGTVGRIAGAIYGDIVGKFQEPPLMLIPPVTLKVRRVLDHFTDVRLLSTEQKRALADEIRSEIVPMLFAYKLDPAQIGKMSPLIESAVLRTLTQELRPH